MPVPFDKIEDKQRIVIIDDEGTTEIIDIVSRVLKANSRSFDWWKADGTHSITDSAPIVLIQGDYHMEANTHKAKFLKYQHHVIVIHHVSDRVRGQYENFESYVAQYEELADQTPKGGTILYNQEDHVANLVAGERERDDIKLIEYKKEDNLSMMESAAKAVLRRIGITEELFDRGLTSH